MYKTVFMFAFAACFLCATLLVTPSAGQLLYGGYPYAYSYGYPYAAVGGYSYSPYGYYGAPAYLLKK